MSPTSTKLSVSAAALLAFAFLVTAAPAARADDYCITNGAQAGHGCGYPSMETCRAAAAGISGSCSLSASSKNSGDANSRNALAFQPKQPHARGKPHSGKNAAGH